MIKPLWAAAGVALLGTAGVAGAVIVASPGGEEEVVQQAETATTSVSPSASASVIPTATATPEPPTSTPEPSPDATPADWQTYFDAELGFSFPYPSALAITEQSYESPGKDANPSVEVRTLTFTSPNGLFALGLALAPNPNNLSLEDWIRTYPGWPGQPTEISVDTERALSFPIDQQGENFPQIYFRHGGTVYTIQANVYGHQGNAAALSEAEFQRIVGGFKLPP